MPAKTHGMSRTRIYYMWKNMKGRCTRESMINLLNSCGEKYTENHGKSGREAE